MRGNARGERRDRKVYCEMERSSTTWCDDYLKRNQFEVPRLRMLEATAMQSLEAIKQHVSPTNASIGKACTPHVLLPHHLEGHDARVCG